MRIWFDILTPKEITFFAHMIQQLEKKHKVLATSRDYGEVTGLARVRGDKYAIVGRYGGSTLYGKLEASADRVAKLAKMVNKFRPDIAVSFCSPEAARVAFGLGVFHVGFNDSPHMTASLKLSIPLIQKLLIPWNTPKKDFVKYGIAPKNIMSYRAIDSFITGKRRSKKTPLPFDYKNKKTILVRPEEEEAAYYTTQNSDQNAIISNIVAEFHDHNIVVLCRYANQLARIKKKFGKKIFALPMAYDGKFLLENCDVFVGSGGTMTAESALLGIPTVSFILIPNYYETWLVNKKLILREKNPKKIPAAIRKAMSNKDAIKRTARREAQKMQDPFDSLVKIINHLDRK